METISKVTIVSDGIVVEFGNSGIFYYSANALYAQRAALKAQSLVSEDPSPTPPASKNECVTDSATSIGQPKSIK